MGVALGCGCSLSYCPPPPPSVGYGNDQRGRGVGTSDGPRDEYARRRDERRATADAADRRSDSLGRARVALFALGLLLAWLAFVTKLFSPLWLFAPLAALIGLSVSLQSANRRRDGAERAVRFYARGLDRLAD